MAEKEKKSFSKKILYQKKLEANTFSTFAIVHYLRLK